MIQRRERHQLAADNPRELILSDVRCFQGEQRGSVRPITLLVGENSTGKTTFLGCYGVLHRVFSRVDIDSSLDFNTEPFAMGSFRDIVRSRRGPGGRIEEFKLGLAVDPAPDTGIPPYKLFATFGEAGSEPAISSVRFEFEPGSFLELQRHPAGTVLRIPERSVETGVSFGDAMFIIDVLATLEAGETVRPNQFLALKPAADYLRRLLSHRNPAPRRGTPGRGSFERMRHPLLPDLIPVAPLRSKPKRTYDPVRETASPAGEHVPMLMMRLTRTESSHWKALQENLREFGRESGLFSDVKVKRHGKQMSDPFQLQVKVRSGPHANIMDVGYGVSQSLPVLVDVMTAADSNSGSRSRRRTADRSFLLQQPEVHLHPRGQAQLANLFVEAYKKNGSRFLIETHSDYIIDRIRISVRERLLRPEDVSILYFEPHGNAVAIHNMTLDEDGNLQGAPAGYRDFFLKETDRLLGFGD